MGATVVVQVVSTFVCDSLADSLGHALTAAGPRASVRITKPADLTRYMLTPAEDSEDITGTLVLVRVEDWLRDGAGEPDDKIARKEIKEHLDEFVGQVSVLAMRGRPVWLVVCPSAGWTSDKYNFTALCRTYTNLLAARLRNLAQVTLLAWPESISNDEFYDRQQDRTNHIPFTPAAFEQLAESLARQLAQNLAVGSSNAVATTAAGRSPELANFLSGLHVRVHVEVAKASDRADVGRILRTAASFSLTGEKPTLPEQDVEDLLASQNCWLVTVSDRLSEYGPTGVIAACESDGTLIVDTMSLSCTVLGKQVEYALLVALQQVARSRELSAVVFEYRDGGRNQPMRSFLKAITRAEQNQHYMLPVEETEKRIGETAVAPSAWSLMLKS